MTKNMPAHVVEKIVETPIASEIPEAISRDPAIPIHLPIFFLQGTSEFLNTLNLHQPIVKLSLFRTCENLIVEQCEYAVFKV
jgi:hypothetical protein